MKDWKYINGAEVGNADVVKDGNVWVVMYAEGTKSKEFNSEAEAKKFAAQVGNVNITPVTKPNAPIKDPKKEDKEKDKDKKPSDPKDKEGYTFKERVKQVTGNSDGTEKLFHSLEKDVEKKEEKNDEEIEKVGNYKTGTSKLKAGDKVSSYGAKGTVKSIIGENTDNIYGEPLIEVEFESGVTKKIPEHYLIKVGNSLFGNKKVGNYVVKTIKDFEIDIEKRPGENYWRWYVDHKNGDNLDSGFENSKEEAIRAAERKINSGDFRSPVRNNKTGNALFPASKYDDEIYKLEVEYQNVSRSGGNPVEILKKTSEIEKRIQQLKELRRKETGNSASDDKFAYVMREFDEGKLKTPDGKVVTDPAQAKAIAYSESKKTENGLARARNAMNPIKYKGYTIKFRPNSQKYYISSGPGDTYVREYAYKEYASEQDAKDAIDHIK